MNDWSLPKRPIWKQALIDTACVTAAGVLGGSVLGALIILAFCF